MPRSFNHHHFSQPRSIPVPTSVFLSVALSSLHDEPGSSFPSLPNYALSFAICRSHWSFIFSRSLLIFCYPLERPISLARPLLVPVIMHGCVLPSPSNSETIRMIHTLSSPRCLIRLDKPHVKWRRICITPVVLQVSSIPRILTLNLTLIND